jgi:hypothetical protein
MVGFTPAVVGDTVACQLCGDPAQGLHAGHTDEDDVGCALLAAEASKVIDGMRGLDNLVCNRKVGADKDVNVS